MNELMLIAKILTQATGLNWVADPATDEAVDDGVQCTDAPYHIQISDVRDRPFALIKESWLKNELDSVSVVGLAQTVSGIKKLAKEFITT